MFTVINTYPPPASVYFNACTKKRSQILLFLTDRLASIRSYDDMPVVSANLSFFLICYIEML